MEDLLTKMGADLLAGKTDDLKNAISKALDSGTSPKEILDSGLMPAMEELGERFSTGDAFLPELLLAGVTMKGALEVLGPAIVKGGVEPIGTMVIGTVEGDIHDLGKNIVKLMFEGAGFKVVDLGTDVSAEKFSRAYENEKADLIGLSSLLTSTMAGMELTIKMLREKHPKAKFLVGGAPLTKEFSEKIGADGYAPDAHAAVKEGKLVLAIDR